MPDSTCHPLIHTWQGLFGSSGGIIGLRSIFMILQRETRRCLSYSVSTWRQSWPVWLQSAVLRRLTSLAAKRRLSTTWRATRQLPSAPSFHGIRMQVCTAHFWYLMHLRLTGADTIRETRETFVNGAQFGLELFRNRHWRCEAVDRGGRRCKTRARGHRAEHQFDPYSGDAVYEYGNKASTKLGHQCSWNPDAFRDELEKQIHKLKNRDQAMDALASVARRIGLLRVHTQRTCMACLSNSPTNMLPCHGAKHGICQACLQRFARRGEHDAILKLHKCPLGCELETGEWNIRVKPRDAGPRILALDG